MRGEDQRSEAFFQLHPGGEADTAGSSAAWVGEGLLVAAGRGDDAPASEWNLDCQVCPLGTGPFHHVHYEGLSVERARQAASRVDTKSYKSSIIQLTTKDSNFYLCNQMEISR